MNRNAVVIGAGKGIGFETAKSYLKRGYATLAVSRNISRLSALNDNNLDVISSNIGTEEGRETIIKKISEKGEVHQLIITAGVLIRKDYQTITEQDFHNMYHTNVYAVFDLIRKCIPYMSKGAHIVTIGSMGGVTGALKFPGMLFYSSSKAALASLTECMAVELEGTGIHINCLALGAVETDMKNQAFPDFKAPHTAEQMGDFIAGFALQSGAFFNGKVLPVSISTP